MSVSSCKVVIRLVVDYVSGRARKAWPRFFRTDSGRSSSLNEPAHEEMIFCLPAPLIYQLS